MTDINVFISTPIASFSTVEDLNSYRNIVLELIDELLGINSIKVFSAISKFTSNEFDDPAISAKQDFETINGSSHFILLFPEKIASGALIELGYAIAQCKKILIITPNRETLPYMARKLDHAYEFVEIVNAADIDNNIKNKIKTFVYLDNT